MTFKILSISLTILVIISVLSRIFHLPAFGPLIFPALVGLLILQSFQIRKLEKEVNKLKDNQ